MTRRRISGILGFVVGGIWLFHNWQFFGQQGFVAIGMPLILCILGLIYVLLPSDSASTDPRGQTSIKWAMALIAVGLALVATRWLAQSNHDEFVRAMKSELSNCQVQYSPDQKVLLLQSPNGEQQSVQLTGLRRVLRYRNNAADTSDHRAHYVWMISSSGGRLEMPYFAVEPRRILELLQDAGYAVDVPGSLRLAAESEHDKFKVCTLGAPAGEKEISTNDGYDTCN